MLRVSSRELHGHVGSKRRTKPLVAWLVRGRGKGMHSIRMRTRAAMPTAGVGAGTPTSERRSGQGNQMSLDDIIDFPLDDLQRIIDGPIFGGPPPTPAEVSPSQVSPSHPTQQLNRGRSRRWFSALPVLRRRNRNRAAQPSHGLHSHSHSSHSSHHVHSVSHHPRSPHSLSPEEDSSQADSSLAVLSPRVLEPDSVASPRFHMQLPRSNALRVGPQSHRSQELEDDDNLWVGAMELENGAREIEAAMQAILMDGIAGALQGRGRRRQQHLWLSEDEDRWTYEELLELDKDNVKRGLKPKEMTKLERWKQLPTDPNMDCQICIAETCTGDLLTKLPCSHSYHDACITPWLRFNRTCPICRFEFPG